MTRPNTFVVGAAKCGTTSICAYLAAHPRAFVPLVKEPQHFAADIYGDQARPFADRDSYLRVYEEATQDHEVVVDGSTSSFISRVAAERIREFDPRARIVVILRDPVDAIASLHRHVAVHGLQRHRDLARALAFAERHAGEPLDGLGAAVGLRYLDVVSYPRQLRRYMERFPAEQVTVLLFDDLRDDPAGTWEHLQDRLGLPHVDVPLEPHNTGRDVANLRLQRWLVHPPRRLERTIKRFVPTRVARSVRRRLLGYNVRPAGTDAMDAGLEARLRERLRPEIEELEELLGRDLRAWRAIRS